MAGLRAALDRMDEGQPAQAEALCRALLDADPGDDAALLLLGLAIGVQGDAERAAPLLKRVAYARSENPRSCHDLAGALVRLRCRPHVYTQYRACLNIAPDDDRLRCCAAEFLRESHALNEALEVLAEGLCRRPDWAAAHQLMGIVLADLGRIGAAISRFVGS